MFGDPSPCSIKALVLDKALHEAHMSHMEFVQALTQGKQLYFLGKQKKLSQCKYKDKQSSKEIEVS